MYMYVHCMCALYLWKSEEGVRYPRTKVTGSCDSLPGLCYPYKLVSALLSRLSNPGVQLYYMYTNTHGNSVISQGVVKQPGQGYIFKEIFIINKVTLSSHPTTMLGFCLT